MLVKSFTLAITWPLHAFAFSRHLFQTARGFFSLAISVCRFSQDAHPGVDYFSSEVIFGPSGVEGVKPVPRMNASEKALLDAARHLEILS